MTTIRVTVGKNTHRHTHEVPAGSTSFDLLKGPLKEHADIKKVLAAVWNDHEIDLSRPLTTDGTIAFLTFDDPRGKQVFWHSTSHILAQAVKRLFPQVLPTLGPPIDEGFYYDFDNLEITEDDLARIEKEMQKIVSENFPCERHEYASKQEALDRFGANPYKKEIIEQSTESLSGYSQGEFLDLCRGPHLPSTKYLQAIKLTRIAGAYWRGDSENKQLTRIYGISFPTKEQLTDWQKLREEAERRDHRKLGRELDLFGFDETSPGSAFFYPNGTIVYNELLAFVREQYLKRGYSEVITPTLYERKLWETSGHWEHYKENMFIVKDGEQTYAPKPMNCPSHCIIYNRKLWSYKELPARIADFAPIHRNEARGALGGLTRVRRFSQDDAHIFCRQDQIKQEIKDLIDFAKYIYKDVFDMDFAHVYLSTRPEKHLGEIETWEHAETALAEALAEAGIHFTVNEGDGAFYGPKIDFQIRDALGRLWQTATIQLDYQLPERFGCEYVGDDGRKHRPVLIHRALLGSLERFIAVMTEHFAGRFPVWFAPVQAIIIPITDAQAGAVAALGERLKAAGLRVDIDDGNDTLNKRIRDAQLRQIPAILIIGEKEVTAGTVALRTLDGKTQYGITIDEFEERLLAAKKNRTITF
jgi:threonyl-tRNA synthetase